MIWVKLAQMSPLIICEWPASDRFVKGPRDFLSGVRRDTRLLRDELRSLSDMTVLLWRTIRGHLRRSRPEKILNVFQRIHLRFFRACGLASGRTSFASSRTAMSDRLLE